MTTVICLRKVYAFADYIAVNISSPNTARLRELQGGDGLERILGALFEERHLLQRRATANACRFWSRSLRIWTGADFRAGAEFALP